jgi:transaldolase
LGRIRSVASFFVSRVDVEVDRRLSELGTPDALAVRGLAAMSNARLAFAEHERLLASERWAGLAAQGAHPQRPLWASVGVKDRRYPDTMYVAGLVTAGSVSTMPLATLEAFADHGRVIGDTVRPLYDDASDALEAVRAAGVDLDEVTTLLLAAGLDSFSRSWEGLRQTVVAALEATSPVRDRAV